MRGTDCSFSSLSTQKDVVTPQHAHWVTPTVAHAHTTLTAIEAWDSPCYLVYTRSTAYATKRRVFPPGVCVCVCIFLPLFLFRPPL